jgi:hypothetical protein
VRFSFKGVINYDFFFQKVTAAVKYSRGVNVFLAGDKRKAFCMIQKVLCRARTARLQNLLSAYKHEVLSKSNCLRYRLQFKIQFYVGARDFSFLESAHPDAMAFSVTYSMCTRESIQGVNWPEN